MRANNLLDIVLEFRIVDLFQIAHAHFLKLVAAKQIPARVELPVRIKFKSVVQNIIFLYESLVVEYIEINGPEGITGYIYPGRCAEFVVPEALIVDAAGDSK